MKVSVVIPSKGGEYLEYTLKSLKTQTIEPDEIVLILKDCEINQIEKTCEKLKLKAVIEEQKAGYFTNALNMGKRMADGDLIIFTDDDVILPEDWVKNYVELFKSSPNTIGSFSSRDVYYNLKTNKILKTPDDYFQVRLFRIFLRPLLDPPHPFLKKYRFGSYISKNYNFVFGRGIPKKECYSLPFRGVNMAFRKEAIENIWFIEHPELKRGFRCEQHFGLQMLLEGYDSVYVPDNYVYHIVRESLSRPKKKEDWRALEWEEEIVRQEIIKMLSKVSG